MDRAATRLLAGMALAIVLSLAIVGLRLSDPNPDRITQRDPEGMLLGFEVGAERIAASAFATDIVAGAAGELFYAEHLSGRIGVLTPGPSGLDDRTVLQLELPPEGRLFHLALHPAWPEQPYLYFTAHEGAATQQRLAVYRARVEQLEAIEVERLIGNLPTEDPARGPQADHFGSALAVCEGYLYVSVGDTDSPGPGYYRPGGVRFRAEQLQYAEGKVLRYRIDGADLEPAGVLGESPPVYALGLRNVFSMDCDPLTASPFVADNGPAGHDQIRLVEPGTDHGWPETDERLEPTAPVFATGPAAIAPTGIVVREHSGVREILFSAFHTEAIYRLRVDAEGVAVGPVELAHRAAGPVLSMSAGRDGCVYFSTADAIWRLRGLDCRDAPVPTLAGGSSGGRFEGDPASIYRSNCGACHGIEREGAIGPSLLDERLRRSDGFYMATILDGRPERGMPSWGAAGMTEEQARAMLEFLRSASDELSIQ